MKYLYKIICLGILATFALSACAKNNPEQTGRNVAGVGIGAAVVADTVLKAGKIAGL